MKTNIIKYRETYCKRKKYPYKKEMTNEFANFL